MASDFSALKVVKDETNLSSKFDSFVQGVEDGLNDVGGSHTSWFPGAIFDPAQIKQVGATVGQWLAWGDYSAAVMADAPRGYWKMNEASGNAADSSGNGNTGIAFGGITYNVAGRVDTAVTLNGTDARFVAADAASLDLGDVLTLEAWVKPNGTPADVAEILHKGTLGYVLELLTDRTFTLRKSGVGNICVSTAAIPLDGIYHHIVATKNGATVHLYLDSVDVSGVVTNQTIQDTAIDLGIGAIASGDNFYKGSLDEVAVYPTALSAARVLAHYQAANWVPGTPPATTINVLADTILSADTASFDFTSISGSYKHLQLACYLRTDAANKDDQLGVQFNGDSANNYDGISFIARNTGPTLGGNENLATSSARIDNAITGDTAVAKSFAAVELNIPHYAGAANNKIFHALASLKRDVATDELRVATGIGAWRSNSAINRVTLLPITGTHFKAGSRVTLYGF